MSIVIVTDDKYKNLRDKTREQELHIEREEGFAKWRRPDIKKYQLIAHMVGLALSPIVAIWGVLLLAGSIAVTATLFCFKVLSSLFFKKS